MSKFKGKCYGASEFKDDVHYEITEKGGRSYYSCFKCRRYFPRVYDTKRSAFVNQYGTRQLMALWAWYNFERHLKKCVA